MDILGKDKLAKLKRKNRGNIKLFDAVDKLLFDLESANWMNRTDIKQTRPDASCVHKEGFYFFDLSIHRTMVLIVFEKK